jgi:hypothetical protein
MNPNPNSSHRYIAFDSHKHYSVAAAVNREGEVLLEHRKVTNEQLPDWATGHLVAEDKVVIESDTMVGVTCGFNSWHYSFR